MLTLIGAIGDFGYNLVRLVHLITVIIGAGLVFISPIVAGRVRRQAGLGGQDAVQAVANSLVVPMLAVAGTAGGGLVGMSDDFWDFGQTWLVIAGPLWIVMLGLAAAVYPPPWLRVFNPSPRARSMATTWLHIAMAVMLVIMTWKFGTHEGAY